MKSLQKLGEKASTAFKGKPTKKGQICPVCQNINMSKSKFCDFCGSPLTIPSAVSADETPVPEIICGYVSDAGGTRQNEDSLVVLEILSIYESKPAKRVLSVMMKGVEKSIKAKDVAEKFAPNLWVRKGEETNLSALMSDFLNESYSIVSPQVKESTKWADTGLLASVIDGKQLLAACIGSVKILVINQERVSSLTGHVSKEQLKLYSEPLKSGDYVLMCCDGLTNCLKDKEIHNIVFEAKKPQRICERLMAMAKERGTRTPLSIVTVQIV